MVAVDATPGTDGVLRREARLAARVKGDLQVVHVRSSEETRRRDIAELSNIRQLSDDLGGEWHEIDGAHPAKAIFDFAVENQVTQIVLGLIRRSRFEELTKGSIVSKVIRYAVRLRRRRACDRPPVRAEARQGRTAPAERPEPGPTRGLARRPFVVGPRAGTTSPPAASRSWCPAHSR